MPLSLGDRIFWSIALIIFIGVIWVKFIEKYITSWGALIVGLIVSALIMKYGGKEISLQNFFKKIRKSAKES
jgi:predicted small integral membrane protein